MEPSANTKTNRGAKAPSSANDAMKTQGHIFESYYAIARDSGKPRPMDTEIYGRFQKLEDANKEQKVIKGKVVFVTQSTKWSKYLR